MTDNKLTVKTVVIGYREPRYRGEPKSRREIHKLVGPRILRARAQQEDENNGG